MKRLALCIGNQDYEYLDKLNYAVADAVSMQTALKALGFETMLGKDLDRAGLIHTISEFSEKIQGYDDVLFYYAGHGFQVGKENILAPTDLVVNNMISETEIAANAYSLEDLLKNMGDNLEQTKIIILDACRQEPGNRGASRSFGPVSPHRGTIIAFSTSPGTGAKEKEKNGHGVYTDALLKYIALPRVEIETVFKKVREELYLDPSVTQIPWEHTSLIGPFYLNPDIIYNGTSYIQEALADSRFRFEQESALREIVSELKKHDYYAQEKAIKRISTIDMEKASANELFVLGRNIYQAACGGCFACQRFIDAFENNNRILDVAKSHILNGIAFEIYYNSKGILRAKLKTEYYSNVIRCLEMPEFISSCKFIASYLCKIEDRPIYIPGCNKKMYFHIILELSGEEYLLTGIRHNGKNVLNWDECGLGIPVPNSKNQLEESIASLLACPVDMIHFDYDYKEINYDSCIYLEWDRFDLRL